MLSVTDDEWRRLVGEAVEARRAGRSVRHMAGLAGISEGLWRQVESGRRPLRHGDYETVNPKATTRAAISVALGWSEDSIDRLARGEEPVELDSVNQPDPALGEVVDGLSRAVESLLLDAAARRPRIADFDAKLAELAGELVRLANRIDLLETRLSQRPGE